eukprot:467864-Lingulodinium_polyedra.AAC.1
MGCEGCRGGMGCMGGMGCRGCTGCMGCEGCMGFKRCVPTMFTRLCSLRCAFSLSPLFSFGTPSSAQR